MTPDLFGGGEGRLAIGAELGAVLLADTASRLAEGFLEEHRGGAALLWLLSSRLKTLGRASITKRGGLKERSLEVAPLER